MRKKRSLFQGPRPPHAARLTLRVLAVLALCAGLATAAEPSIRWRHGAQARVDQPAAASTRHGAPIRPAAAERLAASPAAWFEVEHRELALGKVISGEQARLDEPLAVRVHSAGDWLLKLVAGPALLLDSGSSVPASRLEWRSSASGGFAPLPDAGMAVVARGAATGGAGQVVRVDLRLALEDTDPMGHYRFDLRLMLESL